MNPATPVTKTLLALLATLPSVYAAPLILGDISGDTRGTDAIDIQFNRTPSSYVASGDFAVAVGYANMAAGDYSLVVGHYNSVQNIESAAFGQWNTVAGIGYAFGVYNYVLNEGGCEPSSICTGVSGAYGANNTIYAAGNDAFVFGRGNSILIVAKV